MSANPQEDKDATAAQQKKTESVAGKRAGYKSRKKTKRGRKHSPKPSTRDGIASAERPNVTFKRAPTENGMSKAPRAIECRQRRTTKTRHKRAREGQDHGQRKAGGCANHRKTSWMQCDSTLSLSLSLSTMTSCSSSHARVSVRGSVAALSLGGRTEEIDEDGLAQRRRNHAGSARQRRRQRASGHGAVRSQCKAHTATTTTTMTMTTTTMTMTDVTARDCDS